ncbi:MAG TPA: PilX N-terminal domain-containing pilus assembly protein [bacterium]|jgi:hypothetical protein|nr:PilX N-terminal domain-containing pilus assembly protein [bacterium]
MQGRLKGERGAALTVVLVLIVLLTVLGLAMVNNALTELSISGNQRFELAALYLGEAGVSDALNRLSADANLGQVAACTIGTLTFPAVTLESGTYGVCVQRIGTMRLIWSTGHAKDDPADLTDLATKTVQYSVRVIPNAFTYTIYGLRSILLRERVISSGTYAPVVINTFPATRPMAMRGGPVTAGTGVPVSIDIQHAATQIIGGLSTARGYSLSGGAVDPCQPTGIYQCDINTNGPAFPTFCVRISEPCADADSFEAKAAADDCGRVGGCYFATSGAFTTWVNNCNTTSCTVAADGKLLGPAVFYVDDGTTLSEAMNIKEIIGTLIIGTGNLTVNAGFTYKPCPDPSVSASCSEPALVVNRSLIFNETALNDQCRDVLIEGLFYIENQDLFIDFAPDPSNTQDCDPNTSGNQKKNIAVRFGMIVGKEDVTLRGSIRVEFNPALLDVLPPSLLNASTATPTLIPIGWMSR